MSSWHFIFSEMGGGSSGHGSDSLSHLGWGAHNAKLGVFVLEGEDVVSVGTSTRGDQSAHDDDSVLTFHQSVAIVYSISSLI
ncbi:hypothetical protein Aperf_G00000065774 [Anoplocephala perfoliata]